MPAHRPPVERPRTDRTQGSIPKRVVDVASLRQSLCIAEIRDMLIAHPEVLEQCAARVAQSSLSEGSRSRSVSAVAITADNSGLGQGPPVSPQLGPAPAGEVNTEPPATPPPPPPSTAPAVAPAPDDSPAAAPVETKDAAEEKRNPNLPPYCPQPSAPLPPTKYDSILAEARATSLRMIEV
jgi:hypothetical protein